MPNTHFDQAGINQVSTVLRKILSQATGRTDLAALDVGQLLQMGEQYRQAAAAAGMADPILGAISQMVCTTVFSARRYTARFKALQVNSTEWGNVVRKLKIFDKETDIDKNHTYDLADGESVDPYVVDNTNVLQLNFVGQDTYQIPKTIYTTQYRVSFQGPEQFAQFIAMILTYVANKIDKTHEETGRATVTGMIAGRVAEKKAVPTSTSVVYLIDEYNKETGAALTNKTVYAPENFKDFMEWAYAYISDLADLMTEYSSEYQTSLEDGVINQHTPKPECVAYFYTHLINQCSTRVLTNQFNKQLMSLPGFEKVNFWQSIKEGKRDKISVEHALYLGSDGKKKDGGAVQISNVFGLLADRASMGYSPVLENVLTTPLNAKAGYYNIYWTFNERHFIDMTEKSIVLLLDTAPGK